MTAPCKTQMIYEGGRLVLLARIEKDTAALALQADIFSINIKVFNKDDPANYVVSVDPSVASVITDATAVTNGWKMDSATSPDPISELYGWNFRYVTPVTFLPQGGREYWIEAEIIAAPGGDSAARDHQRWEVPTINLFRR